MAILQVRDVPDELYENLSAIAKRENRSISQETIYLLKNALQQKTERIAKRKTVLTEIEQLHTPDGIDKFPDPATLVREDRER